MALVQRFVIRSPDPRTITVFATPPLAPDTVTDILNVAGPRIAGAMVVPANFSADVKRQGDGNSYIFGTGGLLQFAEPQTAGTLESALRKVADVVVEKGFGYFEPLEVDEPGAS
jgi:hypothetical protein